LASVAFIPAAQSARSIRFGDGGPNVICEKFNGNLHGYFGSIFHLHANGWTRDNATSVADANDLGQTVTSHTSVTLLALLRRMPPDQAAWAQFTERYGRRIYAWCRQWNLQEADAEDVTQAVLMKLAEKMRTFEYDPTKHFRAWLKTVARHAWSDFWSARKAVVASGGSQAHEVLQAVEARDDLFRRLDDEFDRELLDEAMARVRLRVTPRTMEAFDRTAVQGQSGAEAAHALGMKVATVFVAKSKVQKMIQEELEKLESPGA
jgi:RNA polymerase sigma factor (sigma-70 family)